MMKHVMRSCLAAVLLCGVWSAAPGEESAAAAPAELQLLTFGQEGARRTDAQLADVKLIPGKAGGFYRPNNNIALDTIAQFELEFQCSVPGSVRLSFDMTKGEKRGGYSLKPVPVPSDGAFHKLVFELTECPQWKDFDSFCNLELRFIPNDPAAEAVIGFRNARFTKNAVTSAGEKAQAALASGGTLATELTSFGQAGKRVKGYDVAIKLQPGKPGGVYRPNDHLPVGAITQLVVDFKSSVPGSLRLAAGLVLKNGKSVSRELKPLAVPVCNEFDAYVFELTEMPDFNTAKEFLDIEIRFIPSTASDAAEVEYKNARFTKNAASSAGDKAQTKLAAKGRLPVELTSFGQAGKRIKGYDVAITLQPGKPGGTFRPNDQLPVGAITQLVLDFKSSVPGSLRLAAGLVLKDGKNVSCNLTPLAVSGDKQFATYTFELTDLPNYDTAESFKDIEIRFTPDSSDAAEIEFKNAAFTNAEKKKLTRDASYRSPLEFRGKDLQRAARLHRLLRSPDKGDAVEAFSPENLLRGAFYQTDLAWDTDKVQQLEFSFKTDGPGYFLFAGNARDGEKNFSVRGRPLAAIPDGEYHTYVVELGNDPNWHGLVTNYEMKWIGEPAHLGWRSVRAAPALNLIPDASSLEPGKPQLLTRVRPRAECALTWEGETSPGATLRFFDRDGKELPDTAVTLPAGSKEVKFTTPEMLIEACVTLEGKGQGFPVVRQLLYTPPGPHGNLFWRGNWIWMQNAPGPLQRRIWFQRDFELDEEPDYACMGAVGDDDCFVYVNGRFVGKTIRWTQTNRYEITKYLHKGKNRISCRVTNIDSWGGLLADVYVSAGGKDLFFDTDANWLCESKSNTDTYIPEATDPAVVIGNSRTAPWNGGMAFRYAGPRGVLEPVKLEPGKMTVKVNRLPVEPVSTFRLVTVDEKGRKIDFTLPITPASSEWKVGEEIAITYPVPYVDHGRSEIFLEDDLVQMQGNPAIAVVDKGQSNPPPLRQARWIGGGRPKFQLGDEVMQPVLCHAPAAYGRDHLRWVTFCEKNTIRSYRIAAYWQDYWNEDGTFDFSEFDKDVATLLTRVPDAVFAIQVYSFMPEWWLARNPDDLSRHYKAEEHPRDLWLDKQALASEKWLTEGEIPLKALIDHIKASNYADRVWGLSFCENNCGEMFWSSADANGNPSYAGYSKSDYASFRKFLRERYADDAALAKAWNEPGVTFDTIEMPYLETARTGSVGTLLDPAKDRKMIDFFEFRSLAVAKALIHFGKFTKEQTDGKWLVGAYYGYFSEMIANPRRNIQSDGHNGFIETAQSPYVDFVHAPLRYLVRKTGQPGTMMQVWDTYLLHGKMVITEQDVRTSLAPKEDGAEGKIYAGTPDTPFCDVGQFYRSFGMFAATGSLIYWYDLAWRQFDEKAINSVISEINDVYMSLPPVRGTTPFEVAVVSDRDSAYYSQFPSADNPSTIASEAIFKHFNEQAVPFKSLTITDLLDPAITVQPFKFYVMMPTLMLPKETREKLMQRFEAEGATVLWLYTAGASYPDRGPSGENCGDFLGLQCRMDTDSVKTGMTTVPEYGGIACASNHATSPVFTPVSGFDAVIGKDGAGTPRMVTKKIGKATHLFTSLPNLPPELYRTLLAKAGVWRYSNDVARDQYWIGNDVLFLHAVTSGEKRLNLPAGFHARSVIGPFKGTLQSGEPFSARAGMTYGFIVEKN